MSAACVLLLSLSLEMHQRGCYGRGLLSRSRPERLERGDRLQRRTTAANPFHGQGVVVPLAPVVGVDVEPVVLSAVETLYLAHAERCLAGLDAASLWARFAETQPRFALLYFVYHHYRQLGYVVRAGGKFGGDFVLYEDHPERCHAQYTVLAQDVRSEPNMSWPELLGVGRVAENVSKQLMWCRVHLELGPSVEHMVAHSTMEELSYERWAPNATRDDE